MPPLSLEVCYLYNDELNKLYFFFKFESHSLEPSVIATDNKLRQLSVLLSSIVYITGSGVQWGTSSVSMIGWMNIEQIGG